MQEWRLKTENQKITFEFFVDALELALSTIKLKTTQKINQLEMQVCEHESRLMSENIDDNEVSNLLKDCANVGGLDEARVKIGMLT